MSVLARITRGGGGSGQAQAPAPAGLRPAGGPSGRPEPPPPLASGQEPLAAALSRLFGKPRIPTVANGQPLAKAACIYLIKAACYKCG